MPDGRKEAMPDGRVQRGRMDIEMEWGGGDRQMGLRGMPIIFGIIIASIYWRFTVLIILQIRVNVPESALVVVYSHLPNQLARTANPKAFASQTAPYSQRVTLISRQNRELEGVCVANGLIFTARRAWSPAARACTSFRFRTANLKAFASQTAPFSRRVVSILRQNREPEGVCVANGLIFTARRIWSPKFPIF
ncbi:hypothetical protein B0H13DRAFT_1889024 [Mycena leptocephala]|nr:hypothetical protein B0H13DRAFT_1889024 [Mycena leptocephala]